MLRPPQLLTSTSCRHWCRVYHLKLTISVRTWSPMLWWSTQTQSRTSRRYYGYFTYGFSSIGNMQDTWRTSVLNSWKFQIWGWSFEPRLWDASNRISTVSASFLRGYGPKGVGPERGYSIPSLHWYWHLVVATEASGMPPTGMHSCFNCDEYQLTLSNCDECQLNLVLCEVRFLAIKVSIHSLIFSLLALLSVI